MTDEQIIKALEKCASIGESCEGCPFYDYTDCDSRLKEEFHNLINRKDAEIERLNVELVGMRGACESYKIHYDNAQAEIERLKAEIRNTDNTLASLDRPLIEVKHEAYKECVERVKQVFGGNNVFETCIRLIVDSILNELTHNLHGTCTGGGMKNDY